MRRPHSVLLMLVVLLGFGVSFCVPAADVPETPYDESETVPYEGTPLFSIAAPQASDRIAKPELCCVLRSLSSTKRCNRYWESTPQFHCVPDSLIILDHTLRC